MTADRSKEGFAVLFRKKILRSCSYCVNAAKVGEDQVICSKRGVVSSQFACRKFRYDPCKRIPRKQKPLDFAKYDNEDFSL